MTPASQPLKLIECSGCTLHDPSATYTAGTRTDSRTAAQPCLFKASHDSTVDLKHLQQGFFRRDSVQSLRTTYYHVSNEIESSLSAVRLPRAATEVNLSTNHNLVYQFGFTADSDLSTSVSVTTASRFFMKSLFSAKSFASMMSLHRWKDISTFHDQQLIDWKLTWSLFRYHHDGPVTSTSF